MNPDIIWWKAKHFQGAAGLVELNKSVRTLHPGAPEVLLSHFSALMGRKRKTVVDGQDGVRLTLTHGESKRFDGAMHFEFSVFFEPGDYGVAEFDRIAQSLAHNTPVAAAIQKIRHEEAGLPPLVRSVAQEEMPAPIPGPIDSVALEEAPKPAVAAKSKPAGRKSFAQAFMEGYRSGKVQPPAK